jgi:hypothetical protein
MTTEELQDFIKTNIPTFDNFQIIENGIAYHYTSHLEKILGMGRLLGAPINIDLDQTQMTLVSKPATHDPGVVFGYLNIEDSKEEGFGCDIVKIEFRKALQVTHIQEASIGAPDTILILTSEILKFMTI